MKGIFGLLMMVGLFVSVGCGGDDDSSPTSSSVSQDKYEETIVGTWNDGGEPILTFNTDKTVVYEGFEGYYTWSIEGSTLTITDGDSGEVFAVYVIDSLSSTQFVYAEENYPDVKNTQTR